MSKSNVIPLRREEAHQEPEADIEVIEPEGVDITVPLIVLLGWICFCGFCAWADTGFALRWPL